MAKKTSSAGYVSGVKGKPGGRKSVRKAQKNEFGSVRTNAPF